MQKWKPDSKQIAFMQSKAMVSCSVEDQEIIWDAFFYSLKQMLNHGVTIDLDKIRFQIPPHTFPAIKKVRLKAQANVIDSIRFEDHPIHKKSNQLLNKIRLTKRLIRHDKN